MTRPLIQLSLLACFLATAPLSAQSVGTDTDGDGLDDLLEVRYGSSTTVADPDGDGLTDLEEVLADMRPTLPDAGPRASLGKPSLHLAAYGLWAGPDAPGLPGAHDERYRRPTIMTERHEHPDRSHRRLGA